MKQTGGTLGTLDTQVRYGIHQSKGRGVIVDITGRNYNDDDAIMTIVNRMHRSGLTEIYVLRDLKLMARILQTKKEFIIKRPPTAFQ